MEEAGNINFSRPVSSSEMWRKAETQLSVAPIIGLFHVKVAMLPEPRNCFMKPHRTKIRVSVMRTRDGNGYEKVSVTFQLGGNIEGYFAW